MIGLSRRIVALGVLALVFLALAGRLAYMQLVQVGYYRTIANENRIRMISLAAPRGRILDCNGVPLVVNRPAFSVSVVPADFRGDRPRARLAEALQISTEALGERLRKQTSLPLEPVVVNRDADLRLVSRIEERIEDVSGVMISTDPVREYPTAAWAGHLLGYTRAVGERDLNKRDKTGAPLRGDIGAAGLERWYDDLLRGVDGVGYRQINAYGQALGPMPEYPDIPPIPGDELRLTIDVRLQALADSLLRDYVAGTVVAIDVRTGAVVCLETRPGFDANHFVGGMTANEWDSLRSDSLHPLMTRATMGLYPPGSTLKLVTMAAALESGAMTTSQRLSPCTGGYRFGNRVFGCWKKGGHGSLDMFGAIEQSCDVYWYQAIQRFGLPVWAHHARTSGLGRPTGIQLPGELNGNVPDAPYLDRKYGKGKWSRGLLLNFSIGQGELLVTPLQLVQYFAAIANDGVGMRPQLLAAHRAEGGSWVTTKPEAAFQLPYKKVTIEAMQRACRLVVDGDHGTAIGIRDHQVRMAGKTGTAQNPHGNEHAWFVGYAPSEAPRVAVVALVENVGHGSEFAAPICLEIAKAYLAMDANGIAFNTRLSPESN